MRDYLFVDGNLYHRVEVLFLDDDNLMFVGSNQMVPCVSAFLKTAVYSQPPCLAALLVIEMHCVGSTAQHQNNS